MLGTVSARPVRYTLASSALGNTPSEMTASSRVTKSMVWSLVNSRSISLQICAFCRV